MSDVPVILLVEDNPDDADLAILAFRNSQLANEIFLAEDGVQALDYLFGTGSYAGRKAFTMPQVILLDLKLPKIDGLEVLRRIRADERTRTIPVVILTSSDEETDIARSYDSGANSYIRKPVSFPDFIEAVRTMSVYWLALNRPPKKALGY